MIKRHFELVDNRTGEQTIFKTSVDVTLTDDEIIFEFDCKNSQLYSADKGYNKDIYKGDVVEAFICTGDNNRKYYEIEVAPNNSIFFQSIYNPGSGLEDELILCQLDNCITSSVEIDGNDYKVKFSLPLDKIEYDKEKGLRLNIFRIETEGGIRDKNLLAVNPTFSDTFHDGEKFFEL